MVCGLWGSVSTLLVLLIPVTVNGINVDMEATRECTQAEPRVVRIYDVYDLYAQPPQDGKGQRDRCTIKFVGENGSRFKIHLVDLVFGECQIFVKVYDGDMSLNTARFQFGCEDAAGGLYHTMSSQIAISLEKANAYSTSYKYLIRLALEDGPDIGGDPGGAQPTDSLTPGVIAGLAVGGVLVLVVVVLLTIYCVVVYRRKKEEKELARSRNTLLTSSYTTKSMTDGGSVHSSRHSTHSTHSTHASTHVTVQNYPAYRTRQSISDKHAQCASIDSKSYDSEATNGSVTSLKPKLIKPVKREFESMRRGILKHEMNKEVEREDLRYQERRRQEVQRSDRQDRMESNRGLGRSGRRRDGHSDDERDNAKSTLRSNRSRGRSFDDTDNRRHRDVQAGSVRSSRSRQKSHSPARSADSGHVSRYHTDDRDRRRESSGRHRSSSTGSRSHRHREYHDVRDTFSDEDRRRRRYDDDDDYDDRDRRRSRRDGSSNRSRNERSRSQSAGRGYR